MIDGIENLLKILINTKLVTQIEKLHLVQNNSGVVVNSVNMVGSNRMASTKLMPLRSFKLFFYYLYLHR